MPKNFDPAKLGTPVPVGQISRELKKLWETGAGASTRASLVNFAIYCRGTDAMAANTELISHFTRNHACRALLVAVERNAPEPRISAWINAHCHLSRAGAKQICCEQISFLLEGAIRGRLTNIVFGNLDSDLPLYLWWQGDLSEQINPHLWSWVDRLIFDSQVWSERVQQFARLKASLAETKSRLILRDLNWTRSLHLRQAVAQIFDHPKNLAYLDKITEVKLTHDPEFRSTALLFAGWFVGAFSGKSASPAITATAETGVFSFQKPTGQIVTLTLEARAGLAVSMCQFQGAGADFSLHRDAAAERYLHGTIRLPGEHDFHHVFPAGPDDLADLLDEEMTRSSTHEIYLRALGRVEALL